MLIRPAKSRTSGSSQTSIIWMVSVLGGAPHKLRDNAMAYSVSSEGSLDRFRNKQRQVWRPRNLADEDKRFARANAIHHRRGKFHSRAHLVAGWKTSSAFKTDESGETLLSRNLESGSPTTVLGPREMKQGERSFLVGRWTTPLFGGRARIVRRKRLQLLGNAAQ